MSKGNNTKTYELIMSKCKMYFVLEPGLGSFLIMKCLKKEKEKNDKTHLEHLFFYCKLANPKATEILTCNGMMKKVKQDFQMLISLYIVMRQNIKTMIME